MFRLAHLSDVHLAPLPHVPMGALLSKRITGYANWRINRKGEMGNDYLDRLIMHLKSAKPDHIAVTGDLVNLALDAEIENARLWLNQLGSEDDVSVVLGNHDAYVRNARETAINAWSGYIGDNHKLSTATFPFRSDRGPVSLIGVNSAVATRPFMATGLFGALQQADTAKLLKQAKDDGQFRVVLIHHPPFPNATHWHKRLIGDELFRSMIEEHGAELVLHGHTHIDSFEWIRGPGRDVPVIGVPSASHAPAMASGRKKPKPGARYNLFTVSGAAGNWTCHFSDFGFTHERNDVQKIQDRFIMENGTILTG